jgi:hypothetical protein
MKVLKVIVALILLSLSGCGSIYLGGCRRWDDPKNHSSDAIFYQLFLQPPKRC